MELRNGSAAGPPPTPGPVRWRVSPGLVAVRLAGFVILTVAAVFIAARRVDPVGVLVAGSAAAGVGYFALRDLIAPVRVEADADGVIVVTGFARRVRLPWDRIERVRVDERPRYGIRSAYLEIDAGESLHLYRAAELSAPVEDVAEALAALRAQAGGGA